VNIVELQTMKQIVALTTLRVPYLGVIGQPFQGPAVAGLGDHPTFKFFPLTGHSFVRDVNQRSGRAWRRRHDQEALTLKLIDHRPEFLGWVSGLAGDRIQLHSPTDRAVVLGSLRNCAKQQFSDSLLFDAKFLKDVIGVVIEKSAESARRFVFVESERLP